MNEIDLAALPALINIETAARIMGLPTSTVYDAIRREGCNLPLVRLGPHRTMVASRTLLSDARPRSRGIVCNGW